MEIQSLTIRVRLVLLTLGLVIPLMLVGLLNLWNFWQANRSQLNESLEQQAKLAARAFDQRIVAHQQTMETVSVLSMSGESVFTLKDYLDSLVKTRPQWLDVQIVDSDGNVVLAQSAKPPNLSAASVKTIKEEAERDNSFVISTEESPDKTLNSLSLALPMPNRNFVVARINGASINNVFEKLDLPDDYLVAVFDKNNRLLYRNPPVEVPFDAGDKPFFTALRDKREGAIEVKSPYDGIERIYGLAPVATTNSVVAIGVPRAKLYETAQRQFLGQLFFGLFIALVAVAAAAAIARSITQPMRRLTKAARSFGAGDLTARTEVMASGAVRELGLTFNQMAEEIARREKKLEALDHLKSEFVSSVSHELRTPLTTIKALTNVLHSDILTAAERADYLRTIGAECDRQIEFVQTLLDLSRIESGEFPVSMEKVDVVKLLWNCVEALDAAALDRRQHLRFPQPGDDDIDASSDPDALRRIILSLLENAMKYTPEGGTIKISAARSNEAVTIDISDNGCGITAEDLPRIFERFFRGRPLSSAGNTAGETVSEEDCPPPNETSGTGIGLYLVRGLVRQIGGTIRAESPVGATTLGTKFVLTLPAHKKSA